MGLVERFLAGDVRALARLATLVESRDPVGEAALARLYGKTGAAHVVGITGPPGAGKSTLVNALIGAIRRSGRRVGVVAVDPSSAIGGGALLGDRIRMLERYADAAVFIRSMASRGRLGGLAPATAGVVHLLDAAGFPLVLVETVGVGQDGVDVAALADTVVVVEVPGLGDDVQTMKAGLLEVGDLVAINKADRPGADELMRQLRLALGHGHGDWIIPIVQTTATTGDGVDRLLGEIDAHLLHLRDTGALADRRRAAARAEVLGGLRAELDRRLTLAPAALAELDAAISEVAERRLAPGPLVAKLLASVASAPGLANPAQAEFERPGGRGDRGSMPEVGLQPGQ